MYDNDKCILIGDMNACLGISVTELPNQIGMTHYCYPSIPDPIPRPNDNAIAILGICIEEKILPINNLQTPNMYFLSKKTFTRGGSWISELDTCFVSEGLVNCITNFNVIYNSSLPSDHAPITITLQPSEPCLDILMTRASDLGKHGAENSNSFTSKKIFTKRPVKLDSVDCALFLSKLNETDMPDCTYDLNTAAIQLSSTLYECARASSSTANPLENNIDNTENRWDRIMAEENDAKLWQAINWRGEIMNELGGVNSVPSDEDFKAHLEQIYNPLHREQPEPRELHTDITIPVLDNPIIPEEVSIQIRKAKPNKGIGTDGIPPGLFKILPVNWVVFITTLFNNVFLSGSYPNCWATAKLFAIFKRGSRADPGNYRGINVINSIAKIYDMILAARLSQWFAPYREQAGSQTGRGCIEHIVTLRLIMDIARRKKFKLFVTFVDFSKAFDCIPRYKLFLTLKRMGCGLTILMALVAMYEYTNSVIGTAVIASTIGVRQGSPTSGILFIIYVNVMIQMIKQGCPIDGFLGWLHILVMMDDTVLLSTTKQGMIDKIKILNDYCKSHGMIINYSKTKFMVVNGDNEDKEPILYNDMVINYSKQYIYLGSPFTDDGSPSTAIKIHANNKMCHVLKFVSFVKRNNDVPFMVKKRIFDAAVISTILYVSESWLNGDLKPIEKQYKWCIKQLLGVRKTTTNDLCLIELGLPPLSALVKAKQRKFFNKMWNERLDMIDDPLIHSIKILCNYNDSISRYIKDCINNDIDEIEIAKNRIKLKISNAFSNRIVFYKTINPGLIVHDLYLKKIKVNEIDRISWTRLRLSAHSLAIEKGRWNRRGRGRLPMEERLCPCGQIQTEAHVIESCPMSLQIRQMYNITTINNLLLVREDYDKVCMIIHKLLSLY